MLTVKKKSRKKRTSLSESVTDRQELISGWSQDRFSEGRALIIGAGALGNEVAKNLALMGIGYMMIADFDTVERSNLSRGPLFRKSDVRYKRTKAETVARRAKALNTNPNSHVQPFLGNVVWELGSGAYRRFDVLIGCLDNVEARMAVNAGALVTGTPYIDGGILGLAGNVTAVNPPLTACWECTTTKHERQQVRERYSCARIMEQEMKQGRLPSVQVASSIIAGFQTQEAAKVILGLPWSAGHMIQYEASGKKTFLDVIRVSRRPDCWCNRAEVIQNIFELPLTSQKHVLADLLKAVEELGVPTPLLRLPSTFILYRLCNHCGQRDKVLKPTFALGVADFVCGQCNSGADMVSLKGVDRVDRPTITSQEDGENLWNQLLETKLATLGFPQLALIAATDSNSANHDLFTVELTADAGLLMGANAFTSVRRYSTGTAISPG